MQEAIESPASANEPVVVAPSTSRILLALPDPEESQLCGRFLTSQNLKVDQVGNGVDGLVKALSNQFDVIVASADLPGIGGEQLCQVLRQDPWSREIKFVLVSARQVSAATLAAIDGVVKWPIESEALLDAIRRVLDGKNNRPAAAATSAYPASRRHRRGQTVNPPLAPPRLICPRCDRPLSYLYSQLGGINERSAEQWDYLECSARCGTFQYRHRTRRLRPVPSRGGTGAPRVMHPHE